MIDWTRSAYPIQDMRDAAFFNHSDRDTVVRAVTGSSHTDTAL